MSSDVQCLTDLGRVNGLRCWYLFSKWNHQRYRQSFEEWSNMINYGCNVHLSEAETKTCLPAKLILNDNCSKFTYDFDIN